jgi:hypothetical protein
MHRVWELCNACKAKPTGTSSEVQVTPAPLCKCRCAPPPPQGWAGCGWHGARPRPRGICLCPGLAQMWSHGYPMLTPFWCMHCTAWFQNRVCRLWSRIWTAGPANSGLKTAAPPPLPKPNPPGVGYPAPRPPLSGAPIRFRFGGVNAKLCPTKVGPGASTLGSCCHTHTEASVALDVAVRYPYHMRLRHAGMGHGCRSGMARAARLKWHPMQARTHGSLSAPEGSSLGAAANRVGGGSGCTRGILALYWSYNILSAIQVLANACRLHMPCMFACRSHRSQPHSRLVSHSLACIPTLNSLARGMELVSKSPYYKLHGAAIRCLNGCVHVKIYHQVHPVHMLPKRQKTTPENSCWPIRFHACMHAACHILQHHPHAAARDHMGRVLSLGCSCICPSHVEN